MSDITRALLDSASPSGASGSPPTRFWGVVKAGFLNADFCGSKGLKILRVGGADEV